ncbi:MAG: hypothetical protein RJQ14_15045 [Marinoscillum sp.]
MKIGILTFLVVSMSTYVFGQVNLNESITKFEADCSDAVSPEDYTNEFTLLKLTTMPESTTLNFEIVANCAQKKKGVLSVSGDTLNIDKTDVTITGSTRYEKVDSTGHTLDITEETHIADIAFCDCLVNFYYELSTSLENVKYLTFHKRTSRLTKLNKREVSGTKNS